MWLLGLGFLAGGITAFTLLLVASPDSQPGAWGKLIITVIGGAHITAGAWLIGSSPNITVWLRRDRPVLHVTKHWLLHKRERVIHLDEIAHFQVRQSEDSDGDPVYRLELHLRSGERLPLQSVDLHTRTEIDAAADRLRSWSGGRLASRVGTPGDQQER
ncbi:MAG: hypothetical protein ACRENP_24625 [Longimicrobiales bacterium]